jgi:hypothetical protein
MYLEDIERIRQLIPPFRRIDTADISACARAREDVHIDYRAAPTAGRSKVAGDARLIAAFNSAVACHTIITPRSKC